jgi:hypothetical protein
MSHFKSKPPAKVSLPRKNETDSSFSIDSMVEMIEQISSAINTIHGEVLKSRTIARATIDSCTITASNVESLGNSAFSIAKVIGLIDSVAAKTTMLGLNASIEAARAGESGKGFAVVAGEVKSLANQTASATQTVRSSIDSLHANCGSVSESLQNLRSDINNMSSSADAIESGTHSQAQLLETLHTQSALLVDKFNEQNNLRMEGVAQNVVQLIVRNLYERTADVRWWATDPSFVEALCDDSGSDTAVAKIATAKTRLALINRFYSVYANLVLVSRNGDVIGCSSEKFDNLIGQNFAKENWFRKSMNIASGDRYHAERIATDPVYNGNSTSIFGTAVRENCSVDGRPLGVLCVVFDWESQAACVVGNESGLTSHERESSRVLILDKNLRVIGDSSGKPTFSVYPLKHQDRVRGTYEDKAGNIVSFAKTQGYQEFDGLGLIGVVEVRR